MPTRITPLVNDQYYHIYNRGVASSPTFSFKKDYERFLLCLSYYRFDNLPSRLSRLLQLDKDEREKIVLGLKKTDHKIVDLIAFCLMPNHFHLLLKQVKDGGVSRFMKQITDSYTRYFNTKYQRVGPLFQGVFKAVRIETDEQLLHVSRYIHLNPLVSMVVRDEHFLNYRWSSLRSYLNKNSDEVNPNSILTHFKSNKDYLKFVMDQADYGKELERIKHLALES